MAALTAAIATFVVGCGTVTLDVSDLENEVLRNLKEQHADNKQVKVPDAVDCPDDLEAKKGLEVTCTATLGATGFDIEITFDDAEGGFFFTVPIEDQF